MASDEKERVGLNYASWAFESLSCEYVLRSVYSRLLYQGADDLKRDAVIGQQPAVTKKMPLFLGITKVLQSARPKDRGITKVLHPRSSMTDSVEISSKKDR
jgi:hypothetical protein